MDSQSRGADGFFPVTYDMVRVRTDAVTTWGDRPDFELKRLVVDEGRPLVLMARNSTVGGRAGPRSTAADLHLAAKKLYQHTGWDVSLVLPPEEELTELLFTTKNVVHSVERSGDPFHNQFRILDLSEHGLFVSLCAGSGMKTDASWTQPHATWTLHVLQQLKPVPAGFFFKRFDRFVRTSWGPGGPLNELRWIRDEYGGAWAGDEDGRLNLDESSDLTFMVKGISAQRDGRNITTKKLVSIPEMTGKPVQDGAITSSVPSPPPPGIMIWRDRARQRILSLDTPDLYPDDRNEAISGLPDVWLDAKTRADQMGTVMWYLSEVFRPGRPPSTFGADLTARRFSTDGLRRLPEHGNGAFYGSEDYRQTGSKSDAVTWTRSIFANLDFYRTGTLKLRYGKRPHEFVEVKDFFPPCGYWATEEDFERIDRARDDARAWSAAARRGWSLSGLRVTLDGIPARLRPAYLPHEDDPVAWKFATLTKDIALQAAARVSESEAVSEAMSNAELSDPGSVEPAEGLRDDVVDTDGKRKHKIPAIPDGVLVGAMVRGLWQADGQALRPRPRVVDVPPDVSTWEKERRTLQAHRDSLEVQQAADRELMRARGADGQPELGPLALNDFRRDYEVRGAEIASLDARLREVASKVDAPTATKAFAATGLSLDAMEALVAGLADPMSNPHRDLLSGGVQNLAFKSVKLKDRGFRGVRVTFAGELVIASGGFDYVVPFSGSHAVGRAPHARQLALHELARIRAGRPSKAVPGDVASRRRLAADLLGVNSRNFPLVTCPDPALLKIGMAALYPDPVDGEDPSLVPTIEQLATDESLLADFGDVGALAERMRAVLGDRKASYWQRVKGSSYEADALIESARLHSGLEPRTVIPSRPRTLIGHGALRDHERRPWWIFAPRSHPMIVPCEVCGGVWFASMLFGEALAYVCLEPTCRFDRSGKVRWPLRFDRFISHPEKYVAEGVKLHLDGFEEATSGSAALPDELIDSEAAIQLVERRWRSSDDIPDDEVKEITDAYADRARTVSSIMSQHRISTTTFYKVLARAGMPLRESWKPPRPPADAKVAQKECE